MQNKRLILIVFATFLFQVVVNSFANKKSFWIASPASSWDTFLNVELGIFLGWSLMLFRQIQQHSDNFSYIIGDETTMEAGVVDSSFNAGEIVRVLKTENLALKYVINTHGHSDHTAGNVELLSVFNSKTVAHKLSRINPDIRVDEGDVIYVGNVSIRVIHTPGHTPDGICLLVANKKLLTGDTLFVGECGRTDLPGGNSKSLYDSLFNKLLKLDDDVEVFPGHDYGQKRHSTIGEQKRTNYVLQPRSLNEFVAFMRSPWSTTDRTAKNLDSLCMLPRKQEKLVWPSQKPLHT